MVIQETDDPLREALPRVDEGVRKSRLLRTLHSQLVDVVVPSFGFVAEFARLRDVVASQIGDTRILFPEFTPHDERLHVVQLFQLSDRFFGGEMGGRNIYPQCNPAELFLLGTALYTHDWGMAVGREEQQFLREGARGEITDSFAPLEDEADRLRQFARVHALTTTVDGNVCLDESHLRLYVRQTHARRSGARVRKHFKEHPAVGHALAHLCEGHWHDFAVMEDAARFPHDFDVAGLRVNLLAVALQVRLIDLFHITDDRTPYALWRFISPSDVRSSQEWRKHRALQSVSVREYPPGRCIRVQGHTDEPEVWAGLQDLRRYCDEQVKGTQALNARHNLTKYGLDFLHLDWAVTTQMLRPIDLRFNFDRKAIFRILSEDIYNGSPTVFLRELLQNAIDAVRVRAARRAKRQGTGKRRGTDFDTTIYFTAEHQDNGDVIIACRDYGIGMDEHIIRNYFAVAGVSYYRSVEFEKQQLGFQPISQFGIGILSCFMVCEGIEVTTYRDPDCGPPIARADQWLPGMSAHQAHRLRVSIPAIDRQFIVRDADNSFDVGTEVRMRVLADKVRGVSRSSGTTKPVEGKLLDVSAYLCRIAGFVEFPIYVNETAGGTITSTLILHPDVDAEKVKAEFDENELIVHQLSRRYPWQQTFLAESVENAQRCLVEFNVALQPREHDGVEGWVTFPIPRDLDAELGFEDDKEIQFYIDVRAWGPEERALPTTLHLSGGTQSLWIYRDGILIGSNRSDAFRREPLLREDFPVPPIIRVNVPSTNSTELNIARDRIRGEGWQDSIAAALKQQLEPEFVRPCLQLPPRERFHRMGALYTALNLAPGLFWAMVPRETVPVPYLVAPGIIEIDEGGLPSGDVALLPDAMDYLLYSKIVRDGWRGTLMPGWEGPRTLLDLPARGRSGRLSWIRPFGMVRSCISEFGETFVPKRLRFLRSPNPGLVISQLIAEISPERVSEFMGWDSRLGRLGVRQEALDLFGASVERFAALTDAERATLAGIINGVVAPWRAWAIVNFDEPFAERCGDVATDEVVNLSSPRNVAAFVNLARVIVMETSGQLRPTQSRMLQRSLSDVFALMGELGLTPPSTVSIDDRIPEYAFDKWPEEPFGKILTSWPSED